MNKIGIQIYDIEYDREEITPGILHFGVGNFHRSHQEYYTNMLLKDADQKNWGVCGVMIHENNEVVYRNLKGQDCCYGLTVYGRKGQNEYRRIGSLVDLLWGFENAAGIVDKIADPGVKIITFTITEGGYNLDLKTRTFDFTNEDVLFDLNFPERPRTVFGYIAAGLRKRIVSGAGPITLLCCDNLPHNGDACKRAFLSFFERADKEVYDWARDHISFPNCMVDRITPATLEDDIERLHKVNGHEDIAPVYCEDFVLWVIEDDFIAGRPAWERVGVAFTDDVTKYEFMKLGYVNSTHQILSFPGFLAGYRKVDEAVRDERISALLRQYMELDVTPYLEAVPNTDLKEFRMTFMERLLNKAISDQLSRLCFDASSKVPVYIIPTLTPMLKAGADLKRMAFFVACYRLYLRSTEDEKGVSYEIDDPGLLESDHPLIDSDDPLDFLQLSCFSAVMLGGSEQFIELYLKYCHDIVKCGVLATIEELIAPPTKDRRESHTPNQTLWMNSSK